jgi:uncharacterized protein YbaR (Trm112 family)
MCSTFEEIRGHSPRRGANRCSLRVITMPETPTAHIDAETMDLLRCPLTRSRLRQEGDALVAEVGGLRYPIREGFPVMLIEEAKLPDGVASVEELRAKLKSEGVETT